MSGMGPHGGKSGLQDISKRSSDESSSAKCQNAPEHKPSVLIDLLTTD